MKILHQFIVLIKGTRYLVYETKGEITSETGYGKYFTQEANGMILPISTLEFPEIMALYEKSKKF